MIRLYLIQNKENGKRYIGQTKKTVEYRWKSHLSASRKVDTYFYRAIRNYGPDAFEAKQIDCTESEQEANELERLYIGIFQSHRPDKGYNTTLGGIGCRPTEFTIQKMRDNAPWRGKKRSPEFGRNLSKKLTGVPKSEEHRKNIGLAHKGRKANPEHIARMNAARLAKYPPKPKEKRVRPPHCSEEHKRKLSESLKGKMVGEKNPHFGKKHSEAAIAKMKAYWARRREEKEQIARGTGFVQG